MSILFDKQVTQINNHILSLASLVETELNKAVKALVTLDEDLARQVISNDLEVDEKEVFIEEECLKCFALYQPVAKDLRFLVAVLKINNDLERIGDLSVNIAWRAITLSKLPEIKTPFELESMTKRVQQMLKMGLEALVKRETSLAREVIALDDEVDVFKHDIQDITNDLIKKNPNNSEQLIIQLLAARNLERIGDHITNIAEDIIYLMEGNIVRHRKEKADEK